MHLFAIALLLSIPRPPADSVAGRVLDAGDGSFLPGATVELVEAAQATTTRRDGSFTFTGVPRGRYTLHVRFVGYASLDTTIVAPAAGLMIRLEPDVLEIGEVVVTGSPIGSALRYQAVQVFNREALERRSGASLGEMLDGSPGLAMRSMGPAPARPVIRGFDGDRVVVLENGERPGDLSETAADHALALDPLAADRVEVVRGPASLLYGSGAIGGVVNVLSDDIPLQWEAGPQSDLAFHSSTVNRQAAVYARMRYGGAGWLVGGRLAARRAGDLRTPEGVLSDTDLRNFDGALSTAFRGERLVGGALVSGLARTYGLPESLDDPDERVEIRMQRQALQARGQWQVGGVVDDVELRLHVGRYAHDEIEIEDGEEGLDLAFDQRVASATVLATHGLIGRGAFGVSLFVRDLLVGGEEALTPDGRATRLAAFVFEEVPLSPRVNVQAALRAEIERLSIHPNELFPDAADARRHVTFSTALGLNARPGGALEVGLQLAQAFRSPTIEERYSDAPHIGAGAYEIGDPDLRLERALGVDAFTRFTLGPIGLELAAFAMRIGDFVVYQPTGQIDASSGLPIFVYEADEALQLGGEVSATARLTRHLQLNSSADYVRGTRLSDGTPLPRIPPLRAMLGGMFDREDWWAGARLRAVAAQRRTAPNEEATDGYLLAGIEGGLRLGPARQHLLSVRVDNLLDVAYRDHLSRLEARHAPMPGRNLGVTYRVMW